MIEDDARILYAILSIKEATVQLASVKQEYINRSSDQEEVSIELESLVANIDDIADNLESITNLIDLVAESIKLIRTFDDEEIDIAEVDDFLKSNDGWQPKEWKLFCDVEDNVRGISGKGFVCGKELNYFTIYELRVGELSDIMCADYYAFGRDSHIYNQLIAVQNPDGKLYRIKGRG